MNQPLEYDVATILNICGTGISDVLSDILEDICNTFKSVNYSGHIAELDLIEVKLDSQIISREDAIEAVVEVMAIASEECLKLIGVGIDPDTPINTLAILVSSLVDFDVTEYPSTLLDIVEASEDPVECVVNVLEFITVEETTTWFNVIQEVEVEFVDNIKTVLLDAIDRLPPETLVIDRELNKKRKLVKEVQPDNMLVDYTTESKDLTSLLRMHSESLYKLTGESFIKEVVALASIANNNPNERLGALDSIIDEHFDDPRERLKYNQLITKTKESLEHVFFR